MHSLSEPREWEQVVILFTRDTLVGLWKTHCHLLWILSLNSEEYLEAAQGVKQQRTEYLELLWFAYMPTSSPRLKTGKISYNQSKYN